MRNNVKFSIKWRLLAVLGLLLYAVLFFLALTLVIRNFWLVFGLLACILVGLFAIWLVFTGQKKRFMVGLVILVGVCVVLFIQILYFTSEIKNIFSVLLIVLIGFSYNVVFAMLRNHYWMKKRNRMTSKKIKFKNPFLIINPKSGNGRAIKAKIPEIAKKQGISVVVLSKNDDVSVVAKRCVQQGADVLGISGGDGSIGAVASVAIENNLPIVVLPGGTRCHFARDLGMEPNKIVDAMASFFGVERKIDVGEINGRVFLNNASFGLYADIVKHDEYREHKIAVTRKVLQKMVNSNKVYDLQFHNKHKKFRQATQILVGINKYESMNVFELGQRNKLNQGILQIIVILELSDRIITKLMRSISLANLKNGSIKEFVQWEAKSFVVNSKKQNLIVGVDGECEKYATPVKIFVRKEALSIYVPAEGEKNRVKNAFRLPMVVMLWRSVIKKT